MHFRQSHLIGSQRTNKQIDRWIDKQEYGNGKLTQIQCRRRQLLLAQRAYRARNGAHIKALEKRVAGLESALERTGKAIISFTDTLVEPQALASHQKIAYHLRDTVKTCINIANDCLEDAADSISPETSLIGYTSIVPQVCARSEQEEWPLSEGHAGISMLSRNHLLPYALNSAKAMEVPVFVDHLRIACLYQGFLLLDNPSVPLEALGRPFRLLLSLVTRETITAYFHTCLYARLNQKQPHHSSRLPSFRPGGAGTHYPEAAASNQAELRSEQHYSSLIQDALSAFSPEVQKDLDGQWFDLIDLMGFLRAQGTTISMDPPVDDTTQRTVNAVVFTAGEAYISFLSDMGALRESDDLLALIGKGICLGDTPGFKRSDVEIAIDSSLWK